MDLEQIVCSFFKLDPHAKTGILVAGGIPSYFRVGETFFFTFLPGDP